MAIANVTTRSGMAVEDILLLVDTNSTSTSLLNSGTSTISGTNNTFTTTSLVPYYPSGYTLPQIIIASVLVTILMIVVVVGNMLVIIAITTEKALKNIQNWFIASLAVADFFLGLVIMPFSLANELMGYWIFGVWWCDIHSAMDVLLSTASIMNLCLISLDRYWSITQAVEYLKKRTPARAVVMIAAVWVLSALICIPPLLGWKVARATEEQYPKCQLSEELGYVLYSALGSFYIPSCIMVFVYIRIYYAAKARARRGIRKPPRRSPQDAVTSFTSIPTNSNTPAKNIGTTDYNNRDSDSMTVEERQIDGERQIAFIESTTTSALQSFQQHHHLRQNHTSTLTPMIPTVTCDLASDISTSDAGGDMGGGLTSPTNDQKDTLKVYGVMGQPSRSSLAQCQFGGSTLSVNGELQQVNAASVRMRQPSMGIETDMVSEFDPSSSDSGIVSRCAVVKPLKLRLCKPIFGRSRTNKMQIHASHKSHEKGISSSQSTTAGREGGENQTVIVDTSAGMGGSILAIEEVSASTAIVPRIQKPRDPEREKRRIARKKEKRATLILGLIMGSFIACWLPFFFMYILRLALNIPGIAFSIAFWLGYMNSALNPVIYTIFNKDFRRAFRRILFK